MITKYLIVFFIKFSCRIIGHIRDGDASIIILSSTACEEGCYQQARCNYSFSHIYISYLRLTYVNSGCYGEISNILPLIL